ncbi:MAG: nickel pincer cofactor biosynthesis protein LarC [Candidatus Thorarchaeota archaeon]
MSKTVLIDASKAGASGDMILSALIDLIGDNEAIVPVAASLLIYDPAIRVKIHQDTIDGISGKRLEVTKDKNVRFSPSSLEEILLSVAEELELSKKAIKFAQEALNEIIQAEVRAHDTPVEKLHLHETGTVDTILDVIGTAYLLEKSGYLHDTRFICTSVAVGNGSIQTEHGLLEVPVPAVAEIIVAREIPNHPGNANTEVLTPTGAALLATLVDEFVESADNFIIEKQSAGLGTRDLGGVPNILRLSVGVIEVPEGTEAKATPVKPKEEPKKEEKPKKKEVPIEPKKTLKERKDMLDDWNADEVMVIETNVDDVDGEVMGNLFEILLSEGLAYDVIMIPAYGKKNRPCYLVKVIAAKAGLKSIAELMIKHLGTLGIRYTEWNRLKAERDTVVCRLEIDDKEFMVRVKVSRGSDGSIINIKPEADDVAKVAKETGIPIRELKPRIVLQAQAVTE